jgi:hypothetical protein
MALPSAVRAVVRRLAPDAPFIFTGHVEEGAAPNSFVPPSANAIVVRVERVLRAAPALQGQSGQLVTILNPAPGSAAPRQVFFVKPAFYGETIGVRELGRMNVPDEIEDLHTLVGEVAEETRTEALRAHLASAEAVVHARVVGAHRVSETTAATASEHDPDWWAARLNVLAALKGDHKGELLVRYPNSRDVKWIGAPRPREGDDAVFLLHRDGLHVGGAALVLLHAIDMLPASAQDIRRIRGLMQ